MQAASQQYLIICTEDATVKWPKLCCVDDILPTVVVVLLLLYSVALVVLFQTKMIRTMLTAVALLSLIVYEVQEQHQQLPTHATLSSVALVLLQTKMIRTMFTAVVFAEFDCIRSTGTTPVISHPYATLTSVALVLLQTKMIRTINVYSSSFC